MKKVSGFNPVLILFVLSSIAVMAIALSAGETMKSSAEMIEESTKKQMQALGKAASFLVSAEELDMFMSEEDMQKPEYQKLKEKLDSFTQSAGITFTYYMRLDTDTDLMQFVVDNVMDPNESDGLASPQVPREDGPDIALGGMPYTVGVGSYSEGWDGFLTAWAPVYYSDGSKSNLVAGVDAQDIYIKNARRDSDFLSTVLVVAMFILLSSCFASLILYQRKARQAGAASDAKGSFLSRMSHEIRTPLNAIMGLCGMAMEASEMEEVKSYIANIDISSKHLKHVIDDVLDISKIESGKMTLEFIPTNLRSELANLESIILPQMKLKDHDFAITIGEGVPENLYYDTTHIRQVLVNLLSNAMKFTPEGGRISISINLIDSDEEGCRIEWRVADNGIGIDEKGRERLFAPFEQADASTTRKYGGTGLGLAITKQLVEMMGGAIRVESELGKGSEFIFDMHLRVATPEEVEKIGSAGTNGGELDLSGKQILLVEDSEINQMIAINMLEKYGATIDTADNGRKGLLKFLEAPEKYDIIFMDIQMPIMDGYEATRAIRNSDVPSAKAVPIIAMTANVFKEDIERAIKSGMDGHVGKPLEAGQIKSAVNTVFADKERVMKAAS